MKNFPIQKELTKDDVVIIAGDVALCWQGKNDDKYIQKWYKEKNFTTLAVEGNHEGYDEINKLPIIEKFGGKVRKIADNVFYAIRGEIYEINGKKVLTCGGADSTDKGYRQENIDWWAAEAINQKDFSCALNNLEKYNYNVDYFITHTGGAEVVRTLGFVPTNSDKYIDFLLSTLPKVPHLCGHYHTDRLINSQSRILYNDIIELI